MEWIAARMLDPSFYPFTAFFFPSFLAAANFAGNRSGVAGIAGAVAVVAMVA